MKFCPKCLTEKQLGEFYNDKTRPDGKYAYCKECTKQLRRQAYRDDPAKIKAATAEYQCNNRDKVNAGLRRRYDANPELARSKQRARANKPAVKAKRKVYFKKWAADNRLKRNNNEAKRRALKQTTQVEPVQRELVHKRDGEECTYCGAPVAIEEMHMDHRVPLSKHGSHTYDNCVTSCASCNLKKGAKIG